MEISGKIIHALEQRSGTSQRTGKFWVSQEFVIETHDQYPKKCVFNVFGEERLAKFNLQVGDEVTVRYDIDARESNGRWYNSVNAWDVVRGQEETQPEAPVQSAPIEQPVQYSAPEPQEEGALPF